MNDYEVETLSAEASRFEYLADSVETRTERVRLLTIADALAKAASRRADAFLAGEAVPEPAPYKDYKTELRKALQP